MCGLWFYKIDVQSFWLFEKKMMEKIGDSFFVHLRVRYETERCSCNCSRSLNCVKARNCQAGPLVNFLLSC
jgi:hypothetical protein